MNHTLDYYNKHAQSFAENTVDVNFSEIQNKFLSFLPKGSKILDFGCGSGRDSRYFLEQGYKVEACDGSEPLCKIASEYTNLPVKQMLFSELEENNKYDGIWACSSILHLPKKELADVFERMTNSLKENGIIYTSFKYGEYEGERNGRYFTDFTKESFQSFICKMKQIKIQEEWITEDVRPGRGDEKWLNLILKKK